MNDDDMPLGDADLDLDDMPLGDADLDLADMPLGDMDLGRPVTVFSMDTLTATVEADLSGPYEHSRCPQINDGFGHGGRIWWDNFLLTPLLAPGLDQILVHGDQSRLVDAKEETVVNQDSKTLINGMQLLTVTKDSVRNYIANQTVMNIGSKFSSHTGPLTEVHVAPRTMSEPTSYFTTVGSSFALTGLANAITGASFTTTGLSVAFTTGKVESTGWALCLTLLETKLDTLEMGVIGFKLETTGLTTLLGALKAKICPVTASVGAKAGLLPDVRFPPIVFN